MALAKQWRPRGLHHHQAEAQPEAEGTMEASYKCNGSRSEKVNISFPPDDPFAENAGRGVKM